MVHIHLPIWKHEAYIKHENGEYYEHHYKSVKNDPLFIETSYFVRNGVGVHFYEMKPQ